MAFRPPDNDLKPKRFHWLPLIGLVLAIVFAVLALFLAPTVMKLFNIQASYNVNIFPPTNDQLIFTVIIWLVLFGVGMTLVAILGGGNPEDRDGIALRKELEARRKARNKRR